MTATAFAESALKGLKEQVRAAMADRRPLRILGGDTKKRLRGAACGEPLDMTTYRGIVDYTPAELVVVVRAGTPLAELESTLATRAQRLAFEPPRTGREATVGGMLGAGIAGPSRPWTAAVRDHVLGVTLIGADGELLRFGGPVMKNVAGYDVPRLVVGAWGTLGPVVEIALRVVPQSAVSRCFAWQCGLEDARAWARRAGLKPWPLTGLSHDGASLHVRLEGAASVVQAAALALPDEASEESPDFFEALRDWQLDFFRRPGRLWRCSVPTSVEVPRQSGEILWDWGGALRWLRTEAPAEDVTASFQMVGGSARAFDADFAGAPPASGAQRDLEARLRAAFDPQGIFNGNASVRVD